MADADKPTDDVPLKLEPVYASSAHVMGTGNDFTLLFQRPRPVQQGSGFRTDIAIAEVTAVVTIGPGVAKDLYLLLKDQVEAHEKEFGTLNTPYTKKRASAPKKP